MNLFGFSLLIGMIVTLEVSGADLAVYLCQSEVTSNFSDETFVGGSRGMPAGILQKSGSRKRHCLYQLRGSLEQNIKVLQSTSIQIIKRKVQFNISNS